MATLTDMNASLNQSDHIWFARSKVITPAADGYFSIIRVPRTAFVIGTWVLVTTAFGAGAGASITVGYSGNQVVDSAILSHYNRCSWIYSRECTVLVQC